MGQAECQPGAAGVRAARRRTEASFSTAEHAPKSAGRQYTTAAMVRMEREIVRPHADRATSPWRSRPAINEAKDRAELLSRHPQLNDAQGKAADQILASQEKDRRPGRRGRGWVRPPRWP